MDFLILFEPTQLSNNTISSALGMTDNHLDEAHYTTCDGWLSKLMEGTALLESEVKMLVEKVNAFFMQQFEEHRGRGGWDGLYYS